MTKQVVKPMKWPPIIYRTSISPWVKLRDAVMTFLAWTVLILLLQGLWILIRDFFSEPIFHLLPNQEPDWLGIWMRLRIFAILTGIVVTWILVFSLFRYSSIKRIKSVYHHPTYTDLNRLTAEFGLSPIEILEWQDLRCVDVFIDPNGRIEEVKPINETITNQ